MATKQQVEVLLNELDAMNASINKNGQIKNSTFIKKWHALDNKAWQDIIDSILTMESAGLIKLNSLRLQDLDDMQKALDQYSSVCNNVLDPEPKLIPQLPKGLRSQFDSRLGTTLKSKLWRTMNAVRDSYCKDCLELDLPNEDNSKGKLDPKPGDDLFDW